MKKTAISIATLIAVGVGSATPAASQTMLDNIFKRLVNPTGKAQTAPIQSNNTASITAIQTAAIDQLLTSAMQDPAIAADRSAAANLIGSIVATGSCAKNSAAWNPLSRQMVRPASYGPGFADLLYTPRAFFKYHEDNSCLDVVRLSDWNKPANNALTFTAFYVSPQSGEAANQTYTLQKDSQNGWLIQDIGPRQ